MAKSRDRIKKAVDVKEIERAISAQIKIQPHLIYYFYSCGHAHGPEVEIIRKYTTGSVRNICPICRVGWLLTKYKQCGSCGSVSCSLQTRAAPTGRCQHCPVPDIPKKVSLPAKLTSRRAEKEVQRHIIQRMFYLPEIQCANRGKGMCDMGVCIIECGYDDCPFFSGSRDDFKYQWVPIDVVYEDEVLRVGDTAA